MLGNQTPYDGIHATCGNRRLAYGGSYVAFGANASRRLDFNPKFYQQNIIKIAVQPLALQNFSGPPS
jgi:hypothetical protein